MTAEQKQNLIKSLEEKLKTLERKRDILQAGLSAAISDIQLTRSQLRDLGYQAPTATGA